MIPVEIISSLAIAMPFQDPASVVRGTACAFAVIFASIDRASAVPAPLINRFVLFFIVTS